MKQIQNLKILAVDPASESNGGTITFGPIDIVEADEVLVEVGAGTAATNKKPTVLKLSESDDTTTTVTDITEFTGSTVTNVTQGFVIPVPEGTESDSTYKPYAVFHVNPQGRKRYLTLTVSPTTNQEYRPVFLLKKKELPNSTTEMNSRVFVAA